MPDEMERLQKAIRDNPRVPARAALVTDLGTEFGVIAYPDGSTEA